MIIGWLVDFRYKHKCFLTFLFYITAFNNVIFLPPPTSALNMWVAQSFTPALLSSAHRALSLTQETKATLFLWFHTCILEIWVEFCMDGTYRSTTLEHRDDRVISVFHDWIWAISQITFLYVPPCHSWERLGEAALQQKPKMHSDAW